MAASVGSPLTTLDGQIEGQRGEMVADDSEDELSAEEGEFFLTPVSAFSISAVFLAAICCLLLEITAVVEVESPGINWTRRVLTISAGFEAAWGRGLKVSAGRSTTVQGTAP
ncbi:hypothetical protein AYX14_07058 [Cryptococcus neoformans]|nr:hypothetical protein AYX14_07058 [Cryptococcus neoformans var. grubii]